MCHHTANRWQCCFCERHFAFRLTSPLVCRHKETDTCSFLCTPLTQSYQDGTFSCYATQITKAVSSSVDTRPPTSLPPTTGVPCQSAALFHLRHPPLSVSVMTSSLPHRDLGYRATQEMRLELWNVCGTTTSLTTTHPAHKHDQQHPHQPFSLPSETEQEGPFFSLTPLLSP